MKEKKIKKGFAVVVMPPSGENYTDGFYETIDEAKEAVGKLRYFRISCMIYYAEKEIILHEWNSFVYIGSIYREGVWPY